MLWRLFDLFYNNWLFLFDYRRLFLLDIVWRVVFQNDGEEFVEVFDGEVLPAFSREHLDELLLVPTIVEVAENCIFKVVHHGLVCGLVSLDFARIKFIVDLSSRILYHVERHFFNDRGYGHQKADSCLQIFVRDRDNTGVFWRDYSVEYLRLL